MEGGGLATVWTDVSTFFTSGLSAAITVITGNIILTAPLVKNVETSVHTVASPPPSMVQSSFLELFN